jgi:hypothetical protein
MTTAALSLPPLDCERIAQALDAELDAFLRRLHAHPVPEEQDMHGGFIAWVCAFLPEAIPGAFTKHLESVVREVRHRPDYRSSWWYRTLLLDVALFALTDDPLWLGVAIQHAGHGASQLRVATLEALAFVADRLSFDDRALRECVVANLDHVHFYCEDSAMLLLAGKGAAEDKKAWLMGWLNQGKFLNPHQKDALEALSAGRGAPNTFFLNHFLWVQQYVTLRLAATVPARYVQGALLDVPPQLALERPVPPPDLASRLWTRLRQHPLMQSHFTIQEATNP